MFELKRKAIHFLGLSVPLLYCTAGKEITLVFVGIAAGCALLMEIGRFKWERFNEVVFQIVGRYARVGRYFQSSLSDSRRFCCFHCGNPIRTSQNL
ncbi:MAG: hypothetical protein AYK18_15410 [Theionarchaea archaeon DG-70]|nr:MAG: hypothetical protein AYK18_15410 [Theionarchaea archaeon DG-70]